MEKTAAKWFPETEADRDAVLDQLNRMVANSLFCNSKRYPGLLRYLVEHAVAGKVDQLKERTLGIEVFKRAPAYDTNLDPVVRITAGEIRKRIAQYYFQPGHDSEIRIDLHPGSYVPEFHRPAHHRIAVSAIEENPVSSAPALSAPVARNRRKWLPILAVLVLVSLGIVWQKAWARHSALDQFWEPVISSPGSALLCVSDQMDPPISTGPEPGQNSVPEIQIPMHELERSMHRVGLPDAITLSRVTAVLYSRGKKYEVRGDKSSTLQDLRQGPVVMIGAFDNDWTLRLMRDLRFSFDHLTDTSRNRIKDRLNPNRNIWVIDGNAPYLKVTEDYAIVARFRDQTSGSIVVVAAGIGEYGTLAAGEILSNELYFQQVVSHAPRNWAKMNMEAVISTQVINGNSGPPRVLETYFW